MSISVIEFAYYFILLATE